MPIIHVFGNILLLCVFLGAGVLLSRNRKRALAGILLAVAVGGVAFLALVRTDLFVSAFPYTHLLFYSNLFPFGAALFIPCVFAFAASRAQKIRMAVLCSVLFGLSLTEYQRHFLSPARAAKTFVDKDGICRQTSSDTCSAAAIVTLLRKYDIEITEADAAELARTKRGKGTTNLGVYRALRLATRERNDLRVVFRQLAAGELAARDRPAIVTVGLPDLGRGESARKYGEQWSWEPGVFHDVVFLGKVSENPLKVGIADPDFGLEHWPFEDFGYLYRGYGFLLEETGNGDLRSRGE